MKFNESLLKSKIKENLKYVKNDLDRDSKANAIVEALNFFDVKRDWVEKINRDEIISLVTNSPSQEVLCESVIAKVNNTPFTKSLKESKNKKNSKKLNESLTKPLTEQKLEEGTSNFYDQDYIPLLVFITDEELEDAMEYDSEYPNPDDYYDDETGYASDKYYDALDKFRDTYYHKYYDGVCVLNEYDVDQLKEDLIKFNKETKNIAYELDVNEDGYQEYGDNLSLEDIELVIEPGYYEGAQIECKNEKNFDYLSDGVKEEQLNRFNAFLDEMQKKYGLTKLKTAYRMSNGETGYSIVEELKHLNESTKKTVKFAVPESEMGAIQKKIDDCGFTINSLGNKDGYDEFEVVGDADKEDCWKVVDDLVKEINTHKNVTVTRENLEEADDLQTKAIKMMSVKKYYIDMAWKNGKTWKTEPMTLDEIAKSVDEDKIEEKQFVDMMSYNIKGRKDAKNLTKAEIVKVYDYMNGQWQGKDVLWSINDTKNESLDENKLNEDNDYFAYMDKDYANVLDKDVDVYDIKQFVLNDTDNKFRTHYSDEYALITCPNGKGCVVDYEAVGQDFDTLDSEIEFGIEENKDNEFVDEKGNKHKTINIFATHILKTTPKEVMEKAPKKTMKYRDFFRKYKYNDRCASNFKELVSYIEENGGLQEGCHSKKKKTLKEGYIGQTLEDFFYDCVDPDTIGTVSLWGEDDEIYNGDYDGAIEEYGNNEFIEFDCGMDKVVINVDTSEEYQVTDYFVDVQDFIEFYNGDEIEVYDLNTGETLFSGDKYDLPEDVAEKIFVSFDAPKFISINIEEDGDSDDDDDFDESLNESKDSDKFFQDCKLAETTKDKEVLRKLSGSENVDVRVKVADNPNTPKDVLDKLAKDKALMVKNVAKKKLKNIKEALGKIQEVTKAVDCDGNEFHVKPIWKTDRLATLVDKDGNQTKVEIADLRQYYDLYDQDDEVISRFEDNVDESLKEDYKVGDKVYIKVNWQKDGDKTFGEIKEITPDGKYILTNVGGTGNETKSTPISKEEIIGLYNENLSEDTVKQGDKWVNKGNTGETHGEFKTKKEADKQRKAMFAGRKPNAKWGK